MNFSRARRPESGVLSRNEFSQAAGLHVRGARSDSQSVYCLHNFITKRGLLPSARGHLLLYFPRLVPLPRFEAVPPQVLRGARGRAQPRGTTNFGMLGC